MLLHRSFSIVIFGLMVYSLIGCALIPTPEPELDIDVPNESTPVVVVPTGSTTSLPTIAASATSTSIPIIEFATPTVSVTSTVTPTPVVAPEPTFFPGTAEWQPVQMGHIIVDIPAGWSHVRLADDDDSNPPSIPFFSDPESLVRPTRGNDEILFDKSGTWGVITYFEGEPRPLADNKTEIEIDGYQAGYSIIFNETEVGREGTTLWGGALRILTPERNLGFNIRCYAQRSIGVEKQMEFYNYCDSVLQHWIETAQVIDSEIPTTPTATPTIELGTPPLESTVPITPNSDVVLEPIFLSGTTEWQTVQMGHIIVDIPSNWIQVHHSNGPNPPVIDFTSDTRPLPTPAHGGDGINFDESGTSGWLMYFEVEPTPIDESKTRVEVNGYQAGYNILFNQREVGVEITTLWLGSLSILTPEHNLGFNLYCHAHRSLGVEKQMEFYNYCDSVLRHWIEASQVIE